MIPEIGHYALVLALVVALVQGTLPLLGAGRGRAGWMAVAAPAAVTQLALVATAFLALTWAYLVSDFSVVNVAENSHTAKPLLYKLTGVWGNHEGSLLLWMLILTLFGAAVALFGGNLPPSLRARVLAVPGAYRRRLSAVHPAHLERLHAAGAGAAGRARAQSAAAGSRPRLPPAVSLSRLCRLLDGLLLRDRGADRRPGRSGLGALGAAVDAGRLVLPHHRHRAGELVGPTTSSAGAAGGSGIRSRTRRSCRGWPAPRCCIARSWSKSATR